MLCSDMLLDKGHAVLMVAMHTCTAKAHCVCHEARNCRTAVNLHSVSLTCRPKHFLSAIEHLCRNGISACYLRVLKGSKQGFTTPPACTVSTPTDQTRWSCVSPHPDCSPLTRFLGCRQPGHARPRAAAQHLPPMGTPQHLPSVLWHPPSASLEQPALRCPPVGLARAAIQSRTLGRCAC